MPKPAVVSNRQSQAVTRLVDYHIIYALALIAVAALSAGATWGLGKLWAKLPFVQTM